MQYGFSQNGLGIPNSLRSLCGLFHSDSLKQDRSEGLDAQESKLYNDLPRIGTVAHKSLISKLQEDNHSVNTKEYNTLQFVTVVLILILYG
jgi:hypothetical protein